MFLLFIKFILTIFFCLFLWIFLDSIYQYKHIYHYRVDYSNVKTEKFLYKIVFRLPLLIAQRIEDKRSDEFKEHGLIIFTGKQGSGKTMAMTYEINKLCLKYPDLKIYTNYGLLCQDGKLDSYLPLIHYDNGFQGLVFALDEIQATFSSRKWQDFPPDMIGCISQNRKAHRVIYGTSQSIANVDVQIRRQCRLFCKCWTFFGFLTCVARFEPDFNFEGNLEKSKFRGFYFFLQEPVLRYQYDTFELIKSLR